VLDELRKHGSPEQFALLPSSSQMSLGPLSWQMAQHILLMNVAAPLAAIVLARVVPVGISRWLALASVLQLGLIWFWHAPIAAHGAAHGSASQLAMLLSLFAAAIFFWSAVLASVGSSRWRAIFALLMTSKLFCLLGVLLTFAPRALYQNVMFCEHGDCSLATMLPDQQLAGLMMLIACPATYLLAAVIIAASWLNSIDRPSQRELHV
jgi:putative membrane protein